MNPPQHDPPGGGCVPLSDKALAMVLHALDAHMDTMRARLADPATDEDTASDLTNDLALYQLIRTHLHDLGPCPPSAPRPANPARGAQQRDA